MQIEHPQPERWSTPLLSPSHHLFLFLQDRGIVIPQCLPGHQTVPPQDPCTVDVRLQVQLAADLALTCAWC